MANRQPCLVANTDERWFKFLSSIAVDGRLGEVNFWRPLAQAFRALPPGAPLFFRLKAPVAAIVGYGYFAHFTFLPLREAWATFGQLNGDISFESFLNRIARYRREVPSETAIGMRSIGCIVLREVHLLPRDEWCAWGTNEGWHPRIQTFKTYDLGVDAGLLLANLLRNGSPPELTSAFDLVEANQKRQDLRLTTIREGQGTFRVAVLDAYARRCAVTGEKSLPVLDAAHIQWYMGPASNHVQNGISLRAGLHRLYDAGYVTVTPDLQFLVSRRLKEDYDNGREYYGLDGRQLLVVPHRTNLRPSMKALEWHANNVYRG